MKIKKITPFLLLALVCIGYGAYSYLTKDRYLPSLQPLQQNLQLDWPSIGYAAVGTVEDGLLASSSACEKQHSMASMAKLITALAIMEKQPFKLGQDGLTYTITRNDLASLHIYISQGGSVLPVRIGMKITQYQAMQRMLIASDNIMADILVQWIFGSMDLYKLYARGMLKRLGLSRTIVDDASGFSAATVSTPSELIAVGIAAIKNPVIAGIVAQQQVRMPVAGVITNTNLLLGSHGIIGIKTGTTDKAGSCLLFAANCIAKDGKKKTIVGVIMGDKNHSRLYSDASDLLASARKNFALTEEN